MFVSSFRYSKMSGKPGGPRKINQTKQKYPTQNQMRMKLLNRSKQMQLLTSTPIPKIKFEENFQLILNLISSTDHTQPHDHMQRTCCRNVSHASTC